MANSTPRQTAARLRNFEIRRLKGAAAVISNLLARRDRPELDEVVVKALAAIDRRWVNAVPLWVPGKQPSVQNSSRYDCLFLHHTGAFTGERMLLQDKDVKSYVINDSGEVFTLDRYAEEGRPGFAFYKVGRKLGDGKTCILKNL